MSVLQLRRDMVVVEEEAEPAVEIATPFPLRTIEPDTIEGELTEVEEPASDEEEAPARSFFQIVRFWFNAAIVAIALSAYPILTILGADVGDRNVANLVDRTRWTAPWAGGAATLMEKHFNELGWASDSPGWAPMARLTAKPAYQSAMAGAIGEFLTLVNKQTAATGTEDADLAAAARLVSATSTGVQLRAARDALVNHDSRLRRRALNRISTPGELVAQLALVDSWAVRSQSEITSSASMLGGSPFDEVATVAVYSSKGRAMAAYVFLDTMHWPEDAKAAAARNAALAAWKEAAEFHPLIVLNGSPDGSLFGNHSASMGFLLARAEKATADYAALVAAAVPAPVAPVAPVVAAAVAVPVPVKK
ncbi:MAG TPA: hypothetical protein VFV70_10000 [Hyphomonadaceae bacterium]|nr:hypothetical protein [Hyphomonadaceae bacterium]